MGSFSTLVHFFLTGPSSAPVNMPGINPLNSSRPILNNPSHLSTSPFNPTDLPSSFGLPRSLVSPIQNPPRTQILPHTYMAPQPESVQNNVSVPLTFMGNRPPQILRLHFCNMCLLIVLDNCLLGALLDGQAVHQLSVASMPPPPNISTANMVSYINHPIAAPSFTFIPWPQVGLAYTYLSTSLQARVPSSVSGSVPSFAILKPSMMTAPSPGVFTFLPHGPQNPSFQTVPQSSSHFSPQNASLARPMLPLPAPQAPSFQFPQPGSQVLMRPQLGDDIGSASICLYIYCSLRQKFNCHLSVAPRLATFMDSSTVLPRAPESPIRPANFNPPHQIPNLPSPLPPRPGNHIQIQQNYPAHSTQPEIPRAPNQQFSNNLAFASGKSASGPRGGQQLFYPFSPTAANQQQGGNPGKM